MVSAREQQVTGPEHTSPTTGVAGARRPYRTPSVRTSRLYERAALECVFDDFEQKWVGSTS